MTKHTPNVENPFSQLLIEIQEMLRNTTYADGIAYGLTQDHKALENAYHKARIAQNDLLEACKTVAEDCRMFLRGEWDVTDDSFQAILDYLERIIAKAEGK